MVGFLKKKILYIKCVFWLSLQVLFETFLTLRRNERDMLINVFWSLCELAVIQIRFDWNLNFSTDLRKILKYQISWKSAQWEPNCSIRTDRPTWRSWYSHFEILWVRLKLYFPTTGCRSVLYTVLRRTTEFSLRRPAWLVFVMVLERVYITYGLGPSIQL